MIAKDSQFHLTTREIQVLGLLAEGQTCKQISNVLQIAQTTVTTYVERMKSKLDVRNSTELIYVTAKIGII